eukprot:scaffold6047_cov18-Tisochrysis_lutea.AAC.3
MSSSTEDSSRCRQQNQHSLMHGWFGRLFRLFALSTTCAIHSPTTSCMCGCSGAASAGFQVCPALEQRRKRKGTDPETCRMNKSSGVRSTSKPFMRILWLAAQQAALDLGRSE